METITLRFTVEHQRLTRQQTVCEASNTVRYTEAVFELGAGWSGFDVIRAIWTNGPVNIATVLDSQGQCIVPHEVLARKGEVKVNLVGSISDDGTLTDRLTSYPIVALLVDATAKVEGDNSADLTPSQVEQFAAAVHEDAVSAAASASSASESASAARTSANLAEGAKTSAEAARDSAYGYSSVASAAATASGQYATTAGQYASSAAADADRAEHYAEVAQQGAEESGYAWFDIKDSDGKMYVTVTDNLAEDVSFEIDEASGNLEVVFNG